MRKTSAFIVATASVLLLHFGIKTLAHYLDLPLAWSADEGVLLMGGGGRFAYEEEVFGGSTGFGTYAIVVSLMLGWRVFHWVMTGSWDGDLTVKSKAAWLAWLIGLTAYILGLSIYVLLDLPEQGLGIARLLLVAVAYFASSRLYYRLLPT